MSANACIKSGGTLHRTVKPTARMPGCPARRRRPAAERGHGMWWLPAATVGAPDLLSAHDGGAGQRVDQRRLAGSGRPQQPQRLPGSDERTQRHQPGAGSGAHRVAPRRQAPPRRPPARSPAGRRPDPPWSGHHGRAPDSQASASNRSIIPMSGSGSTGATTAAVSTLAASTCAVRLGSRRCPDERRAPRQDRLDGAPLVGPLPHDHPVTGAGQPDRVVRGGGQQPAADAGPLRALSPSTVQTPRSTRVTRAGR